jgi:pyruvate kinase
MADLCYTMGTRMRLTKIVCTLGPASATTNVIAALADAGMAVARLNFSHGTHEGHQRFINEIHAVNEGRASPIALLLDTKGAEIRTGDRTEPLIIKTGDEVVFSPHDLPNEKRPVIHVNYDGFASDVRETNRILLDNGEMLFSIVTIDQSGFVVARAEADGKIGSRRHINLPGADIDLPSVTEKDWEDIAFGAEQGMDFVALSFIRTAEEVAEVQAFLKSKGSPMRVIAKIETQQAVEHIEAIIRQSDGIMVARGDLGAEIPFERIPAIQNRIVDRCRELGKPVIVATHMLESMIEHSLPTRAEVTDVAHAAMTRSDTTMLSGETAGGKHPIVALEAMDRILKETEAHLSPMIHTMCTLSELEGRAEAAASMAQSLHVPAIVVLTRSGRTAEAVSRFRPQVPVLAVTDDVVVQRQLQLFYGVVPLRCEFSNDPETTITAALRMLIDKRFLRAGEKIILLTDTKAADGLVRTIQVRVAG